LVAVFAAAEPPATGCRNKLRISLCQYCIVNACAQRVEIVRHDSFCQHDRSDCGDAALRANSVVG
jgi:hypothetical protein